MTKRTHSAETRAKISAAAKLRPRRAISEEQKAKLSAKAIERYRDPAQRLEQSEIQKAKPGYHGKVGSGAYVSWYAMKQRCGNRRHKGYKYYGALGVRYCERWASFREFYADMGDRPVGMSLERIDTFGDYGPDNCTWATSSEQRRNQRRMHQPE